MSASTTKTHRAVLLASGIVICGIGFGCEMSWNVAAGLGALVLVRARQHDLQESRLGRQHVPGGKQSYDSNTEYVQIECTQPSPKKRVFKFPG